MILSIEQDSINSISQDYYNNVRQDLLPPNEIVTKDYEPDKNLTLKLVYALDKQLTKPLFDIQTQEPTRNFKCDVNFQDQTSLGYHYSQSFHKCLLYAKLNNAEFFLSPQNKCKYLAGFFIPMQSLLKPEIKLYQNVYKGLGQNKKLSFQQYEESVQCSFKNNCFSKQNQIKFSSNYQSSNLLLAFKTDFNQYDLILQNDINSKGTTQWFNFAVRLPENGLYKFNIVNLTKSSSLYQKGMKIIFYSYNQNKYQNNGWKRGCNNIIYEKSSIKREKSLESFYYKLHFEYQNKNKNDTVIFSYCYPYNGIKMQKFFYNLFSKKLQNCLIFDKIKVCQTLSGLPVYVYRIYPKKPYRSLNNLNKTNSSVYKNKLVKNDKVSSKGVVFLARQHPGESQSSFILEGIVQFLLLANQYQNYKKNYHFYIFPIVNVDGVFYGNYRTNLSGNDLNRVWKKPRKDFHPEVYFIKKYLLNANKQTEIKIIIDLHGHSSALNSFFYGNCSRKQGPLHLLGQDSRYFPYYCSKQMKEISFSQCIFSVSEDKKGSARVVLNQMFPKASVYTLQNSFLGYKKGNKVIEYTIERYKKLGYNLMQTYFDYCKLINRTPIIQQKWQKQIQLIDLNISNINNQIQQDSDNQAINQLIQFQNQFQEIDNINKQIHKETYQSDKKSHLNFKFKSFQNRLYENNKNYKNSQLQNEKHKKNLINHIYFDSINLPLEQQILSSQLGFLSIVKIDTKTNNNNDKTDKIAQEKFSNLNSEHQFSQSQNFQNLKQCKLSQGDKFNNFLKLARVSTKIQKMLRKEETVKSIKMQNNYGKGKSEILYIKQKDFLMKRRKLLNRFTKISSSQFLTIDSRAEFTLKANKQKTITTARIPKKIKVWLNQKENQNKFYQKI